MNPIDQLVCWISPIHGARRLAARQAIKNWYEAGESNHHRLAKTGSVSADQVNARGADSLRTQARELEENSDIAVNALDILVNFTIGTGLIPEPEVRTKDGKPHTRVNAELSRLLKDWVKNPEVTGEYDLFALQRMICRTWIRDGEAFSKQYMGKVSGLDHHSIVPYSIESFESDFVPMGLNQGRIKQGIELNKFGRPIKYHIGTAHPGEQGMKGTGYQSTPAHQIIHLALRRRLHSTRGITVFHSCLNRIHDINDIDQAERVAARMSAMLAFFVQKGDSQQYDPNQGSSRRDLFLEPGMVIDDLRPGEQVKTIENNRPANGIMDFRNEQLRAAAGGLGTSGSSLAKNYDGSYSSQRQELTESMRSYRPLTHYFVNRFCEPVYKGYAEACYQSGLVKLDSDVDLSTIFNVRHGKPPIPWIDPWKEAKAFELVEDHKWMPWSEIVKNFSERTPDDVLQAIAEDNERMQRVLHSTEVSNDDA
jgi:lambda family phage portal protein